MATLQPEDMTMRDLLASQIIIGLMTNYRDNPNPWDTARTAYQYADALLLVRKEQK